MLNPEYRIPLTPTERREVKLISKKIASVLRAHDTDPMVAIIALQNVQASVIASRVQPPRHTAMIEALIATLPMYVGAYVKKELVLP